MDEQINQTPPPKKKKTFKWPAATHIIALKWPAAACVAASKILAVSYES
jgi:hypothetical protein